MSANVTVERNTLIAEARQEWIQQQERRAATSGSPAAAATPPVDQVLISEDALLRTELAKLQDATDQLSKLVAK
jgi:hypothetical protein